MKTRQGVTLVSLAALAVSAAAGGAQSGEPSIAKRTFGKKAATAGRADTDRIR